MRQVVHNTNITATVHFVEFAVVALDIELHTEDRGLYPMFPGKLQRSRLQRYQSAALGDIDKFFVFADRAFKEKTLSFIDLRLVDRWMPWTRKIREDPRFSELFSKAGLKLEADI
jgi:hypothetical protein